jgi:hypothetical protein
MERGKTHTHICKPARELETYITSISMEQLLMQHEGNTRRTTAKLFAKKPVLHNSNSVEHKIEQNVQ